jgi:hypothetical protein
MTNLDKAYFEVCQLVQDSRANERHFLSPGYYYQQKCQGLDKQIVLLVYELYGLTEEEIKVVEG